jgi:hypothetical protein
VPAKVLSKLHVIISHKLVIFDHDRSDDNSRKCHNYTRLLNLEFLVPSYSNPYMPCGKGAENVCFQVHFLLELCDRPHKLTHKLA